MLVGEEPVVDAQGDDPDDKDGHQREQRQDLAILLGDPASHWQNTYWVAVSATDGLIQGMKSGSRQVMTIAVW